MLLIKLLQYDFCDEHEGAYANAIDINLNIGALFT